MALGYKPHVAIKQLNAHTALVCGVAQAWLSQRGFDCVITSLDDSGHSAQSKHYARNNTSGQCEAVDLRTKHLSGIQRDLFYNFMDITLEPMGYDVVLESPGETNEHLHVEFDPKAGESFARVV